MAMDSEHHRAFLLCGGSRTLTVFALDSHRAIAHLPLAQGADVVKFDPGLGRIYAACSSGVIGVYQEDDPNHFRSSKTSQSVDGPQPCRGYDDSSNLRSRAAGG
jgi:hypothetical protein